MEKVSENRCFDGRQLQFTHRSEVLNCDMRFGIYLPPQAEVRNVPVLYWLSGLTCTDENFMQKAGAQRLAKQRFACSVAVNVGMVEPVQTLF